MKHVLPFSLILMFSCVSRNPHINQEWKVSYPKEKSLHSHYVKVKSKDHLKRLETASEIFTFNGEDTTVVGKKGTSVYINRQCLSLEDGSEVTGAIRIELKETFTKSDLLLNNKPTVSNGKILVSAGAIFLNATAGGKNLKIQCSEGANVSLPKQSGYPGMKIFNGELNQHGDINWVLDPTIENEENNYAEEGEGWYNEGNSYKVYNSDSSMYLEDEYYYDRYEKYFNFSASKFGWINCDAFYEDQRPQHKLIVKIENPMPEDFSNRMYLVFKNNNTVLQVYSTAPDLFESPSIPEGEEVELICMSGNEKALFSSFRSITIAPKKIETITLSSTSEEALKERIKLLN